MTRLVLAVFVGAIGCGGTRAIPAAPPSAREVIFADEFGPTSAADLVDNVVQLPPPEGMGYKTNVPRGHRPANWVVADSEPDKPRRGFWVIPPGAGYLEQAGRSHDSTAFAKVPVPAGANRYVITFRMQRMDNDHIGFVLGAPRPDSALAKAHEVLRYETQPPKTDEYTNDLYLYGPLGEKVLPGKGYHKTWVEHRLEVDNSHVRWWLGGELIAEGQVPTLTPGQGGYFGIRQRYERGARYDDVKIALLR